jgi:DNA-binding MarR family transcriptional regulator
VTEPRWLDDEEQRAWRGLIAGTRAVFEAVDEQLQREAGMPHTYYEILVRLSEAPDRSLRMSELARATGSSRSRLSHAVARLEDAGWVIRRHCPSDARGQLAELTDAGDAALAAAAPGHVMRVRSAVFDRLTPAQVRQLRRISEALAARPPAG